MSIPKFGISDMVVLCAITDAVPGSLLEPQESFPWMSPKNPFPVKFNHFLQIQLALILTWKFPSSSSITLSPVELANLQGYAPALSMSY